MHYRNGREAKNGDRIVQLGTTDGKVQGTGILYDATPGNDYCNGYVAPVSSGSSACLCDCLHVDDLAALLAEKGLDKRPESKPASDQQSAAPSGVASPGTSAPAKNLA